MASSQKINIGTSFDETTITITRKGELLYHLISDEELDMLSTVNRDWTLEAIWACVGLFAGTAKGAISAMYDAYVVEKAMPISSGSLVDIVLFFVAIALGSALYLANCPARTRIINLVRDIRERKETSA